MIDGKVDDKYVIDNFIISLKKLKKQKKWIKKDLVAIIQNTLPDLNYNDLNRYLDQRM